MIARGPRRAVWALSLLLLVPTSPGHGQGLREVRVALSFPNGPVFPYYSVAEELGYFAQEGVKAVLVTTPGSGAAYKAMASGQTDVAHAQPAQVLNGLALGEDVVAWYVLYQGHVFQFVTTADSPVRRVADLKGAKVGVSSVAGGQYAYLIATLEGAGLTVGPGKDVEVAEIGRGGAAGIALRERRVAAYSASFVDMLVIRQQGIEIRELKEGPSANFFSDVLVARRATLREPRVAVGLPRAIAKATVFCFENQEACWRIVAKHVPDTARRPEFTRPLLAETLVLHRLPAEARGQWGFHRADAWQAVHDYLVRSGQLTKPVDVSRAFTNEYIAAINQFDPAAVKAEAKAFR